MKKATLAILLCFTALIFGCTNSSSNQKTDADLRKGTDGLTIELTKNAPPDKIFEDSIFPIAIKLQNKGASNIEAGFLSVGMEQAFVTLLDQSKSTQPLKIEGKSLINQVGGQDYITLDAKTKKIGTQSESHPTTLFVTACYQYKTVLGSSVCVDTDVFGLANRKKTCTAQDLQFANGQGAPVAITKIESRMFPSEDKNRIVPQFLLYVENKGNGEVLVENALERACGNQPLKYTDFNRIIVKASLSNQQLNCKITEESEAILRLRDKKDVVRCTLDAGIEKSRDPYVAPLNIILDYGYTYTTSKDITIEKILKY